jgi:hypothetical protein
MALVRRRAPGHPAGMMQADVSPKAVLSLGDLRFPDLAVSAYLPTDAQAGRHYYPTLIDDLVRASLPRLTETEWTALEREMPDMLAALSKRRFDCPAVAVFSCRPIGLLRIWRLPEPVSGRIAVADRLELAPIRHQLLEHPPALAAFVDKRQARLYALVLDELTEVARLEGIPIRRHKQGGWSASALQRRQDEHARWNLGEVAGAVAALLGHDAYGRLILAGPREARAALKSRLPAFALRLLAADGPVPLHACGNELSARLRAMDHRPARA